ncbi:glycosyltransferase [Thiocapsa rosea]|uniref:GT2 family glycosyltransferase n=1 Tax=Thiocapsa rosea TaxID=69360 RepID=A0A495V5B9_9GAMM|nr:glycosyltransferase [Thiocapsa rosea]RKT44484.1 GT2 family glycosyltransferase [Thiocapsa rosea]
MKPRLFGIDRVLQTLWHRLPLSGRLRFAAKSIAFRALGPWFSGTSAYRDWVEQRQWMDVGVKNTIEGIPTSFGRTCPVRLRIASEVSDIPVVSVIVPVFQRLSNPIACLDSIATHPPAVPIEVIVIDVRPGNDVDSSLAERSDIRYLRMTHDLGVVAAANRGAALAHGDLMFFLSQDTRVLDGWLDASMASASRIPEAGLVGSQLLFPNGRVKEAGRIIGDDGWTRRYGHQQDSRSPELGFMRDADAFSFAAILVRRVLMEDVGGFDPSYTCLDFAAMDLCFAVRASGYRVIYQPRSQVIQHAEGHADSEVSVRANAGQDLDHHHFAAKWREMIMAHVRSAARSERLEADRRPAARMLIIDACTPTPDRDSGSIDLLNYLRVLDSLDYRVTFIPADLLYAGPYTHDLQDMGVECLYLPFSHSVEKLLRARGEEFDVVMLMRLAQGSRYLKRVRALCPHAKVIFNTVDLHYLREERRTSTQTGAPSESVVRRMKHQELEVVRGADTTIVISPIERELVAKEVPAARLRVIPLLREIPGRGAGYDGRRGILFIGGFRHPPNADGILWFCERVWPIVHRRLPDIELSIVGSYPTPEVLGLEGNGVEVLGYVEDIEPLFARVRITVAPLLYGAGLKGKVVTSLGYGVPCVVTPTAAEGLELDDGQGILVAAEPEAFAAAIVRLYEVADEWERSSLAGLRAVTERFSVAANRHLVRNLLTELGLPA